MLLSKYHVGILIKFEGSDRTLGLQMKSVGEVMGIGRSFQEALHKATQSLEIKRTDLVPMGKAIPITIKF